MSVSDDQIKRVCHLHLPTAHAAVDKSTRKQGRRNSRGEMIDASDHRCHCWWYAVSTVISFCPFQLHPDPTSRDDSPSRICRSVP